MVTIEAGVEKEHFVVHQSLLCAKSQYFFKALCGSYQEAITRFVKLPDVLPNLLRIFVTWLYHGNLVYVPLDERTINGDFQSLKITKKDSAGAIAHQTEDSTSYGNTTETTADTANSHHSGNATSAAPNAASDPASTSIPRYESDDPRSWPRGVLIRLYILADRFDVRELRDDTLSTLIHARIEQKSAYRLKELRYIYLNTSAKSMLRRYVVHRTAYNRCFTENASYGDIYPPEFLAAVMVKNSRRLPKETCRKCHQRAFKGRGLEEKAIDDMVEDRDIIPYYRDICFYHEHHDEEEREACRVRHEESDGSGEFGRFGL